MRFSIIIPAYNAENHIRKALDSIKQQTFTDYELIVICDSCDDSTEQIAKEYGAITESVRFGRDGLTRNRGIEKATGEWILFMDDDDWWLHEYVLEQLDQKLKENPNIDVIAFSFIFKGWMYATPKSPWDGHWIAVWNKCWKRELIQDCRFSDEWSVSDVQFHRQAMSKKPRILDWDMPMYYYNYLRKGSISERDKHTVPGK